MRAEQKAGCVVYVLSFEGWNVEGKKKHVFVYLDRTVHIRIDFPLREIRDIVQIGRGTCGQMGEDISH